MIEQGTVLDNTYKVIRAIGSGGGGEIYLADHLRLEKPVVIKKIKDSMQGVIENRGEADILKNLNHPYLPQVYDFFIENNQVYTVMEYIEGENFQQLLKKGKKFAAKDIIKWGTQLSEVLAYLHSQTPAIIHRDIKPANIMLTPKGNVCLIDFNVSIGQDTKKGVLAHSDGYSPPEQYGIRRSKEGTLPYNNKGGGQDVTEILDAPFQQDASYEFTEILSDSSSGIIQDAATEILESNYIQPHTAGELYEVSPTIDERSDIYSLGATLYHMITRERPQKATEQVTPLGDCNIRVGDGLVYIIEKAMQKEPEKRFQTADKMHDAFVNIKKLDHEYVSYARKRDILTGVVIALASVSIICTVLGYKKMKAEEYNAYVAQIESANELCRQGMFQEASQACQSAVEMRPEDLTAYIELVNIYYMWQYYAEGVANVQKIQIDTENFTEEASVSWATLQFLAGECYMGLEEFNLAADSYKKAIEFQPGEGVYYTRCAIALARDNDREGAEKFLEDALQKGISDAEVYLTKAEITLSEKKYEEAEALIYKVLDMTEDSDISYHAYLTGVQIYEDGRSKIKDALDKERQLLETAVNRLDSSYGLSLSEKLADVYYELAGQEENEERAADYYEKALLYFEDIFQNGYRNFHVLQNIAVINQTLERYEEAETVLLDMIEIYPEDYRGYMYLTLLYTEIQNKISIEKRDYSIIFEYYGKADNLYQRNLNNGGSVDTNMQILGNLVEDLKKL